MSSDPTGELVTAATGGSSATPAPPRPVTARPLAPLAGPLVALAVAVAIPVFVDSSFTLARYETILLYVMVGIGLNLSLGYAGEFILGQVVSMGAAAYAAGLASAHLGWEASFTLALAIPAGVVTGVVVHLPGLRIRGWPLALTGFLAVVGVFPEVVVMGKQWTGGDDGLIGVKPLVLAGHRLTPTELYFLTLVATAVSWVAVRNLIRSSWGIRFQALRDAPRAAEASGLNLTIARLLVYSLSAVPTAVAGWLLVHRDQFIAPQGLGYRLMVLLLVGVLLGGRGTLWGPVIGVAIVQGFSLLVGPFSVWNNVFVGSILAVVVILLPRGLLPSVHDLRAMLARRSGSPPAQAFRPVVDEPPPLRRGANASTDGSPALAAVGIHKRFGGNIVLEDVDLVLRRGRLTGLLGANGSGKTTFVNLVTGFVHPDEGEIRIAGRVRTRERPHQIANLGVARTFQIPQLVGNLTVGQNVELALLRLDRPRLIRSLLRAPRVRRLEAERRQRVREFCRWLGMEDALIDRRVDETTLGMQRVIEIARAVIAEPDVVLLDEPVSGVHLSEVERLKHTLRRLRDAGEAVLIIEHDIPFVLETCDDVYLLDAGRVLAYADLTDPSAGLPPQLEVYLRFARQSATESMLVTRQ